MDASSTHDEYYRRQILIPQLGAAGQTRLKEARVLVVGVGGLGCAAATYLALAGVGNIGLLDFDRVELANLHRQPLYSMEEIGRPMAEVAAEALGRLVRWLQVTSHVSSFTVDSGLRLAPDYDLILDCTNSATARRDINQVAVLLKKPFVYASVYGMSAQLSLFVPGDSPCYACLHPHATDRDATPTREGGMLGALAGMTGALQAGEAIKLITGLGRLSTGKLLQYEMDTLHFRETDFARDPGCKVCSHDATGSYDEAGIREISIDEFLERRRGTSLLILDVREPDEFQSLRMRDSISIPLSDLPDKTGSLSTERPIVTVCNAGIKSRSAARILKKQGLSDVFSLQGRILTLWKAHPELFEA